MQRERRWHLRVIPDFSGEVVPEGGYSLQVLPMHDIGGPYLQP